MRRGVGSTGAVGAASGFAWLVEHVPRTERNSRRVLVLGLESRVEAQTQGNEREAHTNWHMPCPHGRWARTRCKDCGGSGLCEHGRRHSQCKECGGGNVCEHARAAAAAASASTDGSAAGARTAVAAASASTGGGASDARTVVASASTADSAATATTTLTFIVEGC